MMGLRKLSPGGHEHLTNSVACADRDRRVKPAELLSDHYLSRGYPAGEWFGGGAQALELSGAVTPAQMNALFGEGQHPHADAIEAEMIAGGATAHQAPRATRLGRRFPQYSQLDHLRSTVSQAYKDYNREHGRPVGAPLPFNPALLGVPPGLGRRCRRGVAVASHGTPLGSVTEISRHQDDRHRLSFRGSSVSCRDVPSARSSVSPDPRRCCLPGQRRGRGRSGGGLPPLRG